MTKPNKLMIDEVEYIRADAVPKLAKPTAKQLAEFGPYAHAANKRVLVRTATYFLDGILVGVYPQELVLHDATTVFNLGSQSNLATGKWAESEAHPKGPLVVGRGAVIDVSLVG